MGAALLAFGSAIAGAIIGAILQKMWTPDPSLQIDALRQQVAKFQSRVDTLEAERSQREANRRFAPKAEIMGEPPEDQHLSLVAEREFEVRRIDYIADTGAAVAFEEVKYDGKSVLLPISKTKVMQIWNLLPRQGSLPIPMKFRCHILIETFASEIVVEALIKPEWRMVGASHTFFLKVVIGL